MKEGWGAGEWVMVGAGEWVMAGRQPNLIYSVSLEIKSNLFALIQACCSHNRYNKIEHSYRHGAHILDIIRECKEICWEPLYFLLIRHDQY